MVSRRHFGKLLIGGSLGAGLLDRRPVHAQGGKDIVVTSWGGFWEKAIRSIFVPCYEKKTGGRAEVLLGSHLEWLAKAKATRSNPAVHVMLSVPFVTLEAIELGLADKYSVEKVPNLKDIRPEHREPWGDQAVAFDFSSIGLAYNSEKIKDPPKTWVEFFDRVARGDFGRRVGLISLTDTSGPTWLWTMAHVLGGSVDRADAAFDRIKAMKANVLKFWVGGAEAINLLSRGEIDITPLYDGRTWAFHDSGAKWVRWYPPAPGAVYEVATVIKIKGAPDSAWAYVDCLMDPTLQLEFAKQTGYGVTNAKVQYPPDLGARIPKPEQLLSPPFAEIRKRVPQWLDRWNREIAG